MWKSWGMWLLPLDGERVILLSYASTEKKKHEIHAQQQLVVAPRFRSEVIRRRCLQER